MSKKLPNSSFSFQKISEVIKLQGPSRLGRDRPYNNPLGSGFAGLGASRNLSLILQRMSSVYLHAALSQNPQYLSFFLPGNAQAHAAVGAEVAGHGDQLIGYPFGFHQFLSPEGEMDGWKKNNALGHLQASLRAMRPTA
jgi:hypothetical protein